jgi:hypothetical protein
LSEQAKRRSSMDAERVYRMAFGLVYPLYVKKAEKKGRTKEEVDEIVRWLTGYDQKALGEAIEAGTDFETFFARAPGMHPNASKITGTICGYRIEEIEDPVIRDVRRLDKLVDELAKGRPLAKILRT